MTKVRHLMSSTRDWMRGGGELERPARAGLPLAGIVAWALGLVVVVDFASVLARLFG
jgi:hypothetical protein